MHSIDSSKIPPRSDSPIREQRTSVLFMLFLLIVSGVTATVVGYRVKSADWDRKRQLLATYEQLGGSFEKAATLGTSIYNPSLNRETTNFILGYEVNSRARQFGLYQVLETTPVDQMEATIKSLYAIKATEAARSTEDAWHSFAEDGRATSETERKGTNPKAARFARQYDRYLARDTEVKLFAYLRDHRTQITP